MRLFSLAVCALVMSSACSGSVSGSTPTTGAADVAPSSSAEVTTTSAPAATFTSSAPEVPEEGVEAPGIVATPVVELPWPLSMAQIPETENWFVAQSDGRIRFLRQDGGTFTLEPEPVLDLSEEVNKASLASEDGMLGVTVSPDGTRLILSYTARLSTTDPEACEDIEKFGNRWRCLGPWSRRIVEYRLDGETVDPASRLVLFEEEKEGQIHNGGDVHFNADGELVASFGDGYWDDRDERAADPTHAFGTISVITEGQFTPLAIGLRNPWRFTIDDRTGAIVLGDVGRAVREEVDLIQPEAATPVDFGWPFFEGSIPFREGGDWRATEPPLYEWDREQDGGCAVVGGVVARGPIEPLFGRYLFADYCSGTIWALDFDDPSEPQRIVEIGGQVVSFAQSESGRLFVLTPDGIVELAG